MMKKSNQNATTLKPIYPNAGISAEYQKRLKKLVREMHSSIEYWLLSAYKANQPLIAQDDLPSAILQSAMDRLAKQWLANFDKGAQKLAVWFAQKTKDYSDGTLQRILKDAGFAVEFKMTETMQDAYSAVINEQVGLIKSIAERHLSEVQGLVMRSVQQGRKLSDLTNELQARYALTRKRAVLIAQHQNNMATATLERTRHLELAGPDAEAIWMHSHAGKVPRQSHVHADGKTYKVKQGMFLDGKWVWPGTEINCRCTGRLIIPGFID
jgi:uncharacterized protein with gpF-like domain